MGEFSKVKWKRCVLGDHDVPRLWKSKPAACKSCWLKHKPATKIKPVSDTELKRLSKYRKARAEHFKEHPYCQYPGCTSPHITLHHGAGRIGDLLWNKRYFKSLCAPHHRWVEENATEAKSLKLSFDRTNK